MKRFLITALQTCSHFAKAINEYVGRAISWLTTGLVLVFCIDVLLRYVFKSASVAFYEIEWHLFSLIFLLGAGYSLKHDRHVRVDIFYARFSPKAKAWINFLGVGLFLIPFAVLVIKSSIPYVAMSYRINESSADAGGLPYRYLIKSAITAGFSLLLLQGIALMLDSLLILLRLDKSTNQL
ncbi:MAG: TRAP transporter small permease subunit [Cytophagales bacterium]|nr:TRAP transporter small permease subunit [Bernardetiaceae bacterium]MDW8209450.1 TRAP transporter small permease subunit [Cytophagales bacterium]